MPTVGLARPTRNCQLPVLAEVLVGLSGCLSCCDAMKQGSDGWLDQLGHLLDIAQYTFEVPQRRPASDSAGHAQTQRTGVGDVRAYRLLNRRKHIGCSE